MITTQQAINKYGNPLDNNVLWERKNMILLPLHPAIPAFNPVIPARIYVNKDFGKVVNVWLLHMQSTGLLSEIKTWDGIFNIRKKRGLASLSLHAFGIALDINAGHNPLGLTREQAIAKGLRPFSVDFIKESRKYVDCGADWEGRKDLMHFQIKEI